jgi:hypothetical protein
VGCTDGEVGYIEAEEAAGAWSEIIPHLSRIDWIFLAK